MIINIDYRETKLIELIGFPEIGAGQVSALFFQVYGWLCSLHEHAYALKAFWVCHVAS